ncbi:MAG: flavin-containing monooxygenase [Pseudomonadales bacterium]
MTKHIEAVAEIIAEDDATIAAALESASIPTLMMAMIHITGDTGILHGATKPQTAILGEVQGFLSEEDKAEVRAQALEVLKAYRDGGCKVSPLPARETIHAMMSFVVGEHVSAEYVPMMLEEMALDGEDARDVHWKKPVPEETKQAFHVLVIGAGMSGILAAIRLQEAGIPYTVVEKDAALGGTWNENTYPGARVDIANHFYCYSFEPNHDWRQFFAQQGELREYFERCAAKYDVYERINFNTEVTSARFDEATSIWTVTTRGQDGESKDFSANAIISGVGQLNRPKIPDIKGLDTFQGPYFHSAHWQHEHALNGKRIAVIGTGASAFQLVPEIAKEAQRLTVFQRSPAWMFPNPNYHAYVSEGKKWLLKHVPYYARWYRFLLFWPGSDGLLPSLTVDPQWPHQERSINELNEGMRIAFTDYLHEQVGDDPELLKKVVPSYPPFGKRMLQDNGSWLAALKRDNVELVTDGIREITANGVVDNNGDEYPVEVIVFATGFHANRFLWPMEITGRSSVKLHELWGEDPRAYLGITVPAFPNLFCLYGPSTNLAHAGSIIFNSECQVRYSLACIEALLENGLAAMECKQDVHDAFNKKLDKTLDGMVWSHPGMNSLSKNSKGRATTTSPWRLVDYWRWTRDPDLDDYELTPIS